MGLELSPKLTQNQILLIKTIMKLKQFILLAAFGLTASATLTSCEDILGHWERPTGAAVTIYSFSLQDLSEAAITATALKVTDQAGTEIATAESDGKYTIKADDLGSATDLWLEATTATGNYIAKAKVSELSAISESGKLKMATIGDVILTNGTFAVPSSTEAKAAMIAYIGNDADASDGSDPDKWHGLAIALTDANSGNTCTWGTAGPPAGVSTSSTMTDHKGYLNGIADAQTLKTSFGDDKAAGKAAAYSVTGFTPGDYGYSDWFLPSSGQWLKFFDSAGVDVAGWTAWGRAPAPSGGSTGDNWTKINTLLGAAESSIQTNWYWSSSEYGGDDAVRVSFNSSNGVLVGNDDKENNYRVRSFLAF